MSKRKILILILIILGVLLIPFIAMQFTKEVSWTLSDFLIAAVILFSFGLLLDFARRKVANKTHKFLVTLGLFILLLLIWMQLAVGIFN